MRVLFLSRWFPYPTDNGARIRVFNLLRQLATVHSVDLVSFASDPVTESSMAAMREICCKVEIFAYHPFRPNSIVSAAGFFAGKPRSVIDTYSKEMAAAVVRLHRQEHYDLVIASQFEMAPYALLLPDPIERIWEEIELAVFYENYTRQHQILHRLRQGLTWRKMAHYTHDTLLNFHGCTTVTEKESELVASLRPNDCSIEVIPNGVDVAGYRGDFGAPEPDTLVYAGALTYHANFGAMACFIGEILPGIQARGALRQS
ncbi:MAG: glycosyltransferase [Caldilineaceae bacterium]